MANAPEYVKIRKGIHVVQTVGDVKLAVDKVTQQRALIVSTPAGPWPAMMDPDDYLQLGIAIIRDSGNVHDFSEKIVDHSPVIEHVDGRPSEGVNPDRDWTHPCDTDYPDEMEMDIREQEIALTDSVRTEMAGPDKPD